MYGKAGILQWRQQELTFSDIYRSDIDSEPSTEAFRLNLLRETGRNALKIGEYWMIDYGIVFFTTCQNFFFAF